MRTPQVRPSDYHNEDQLMSPPHRIPQQYLPPTPVPNPLTSGTGDSEDAPVDLWRGVLPLYGGQGDLIGTGAVIDAGLVLTALHVVDPERTRGLRVGPQGLPVSSTATLPLRRYGPDRGLARQSYRRTRELTGYDDGTVDLALLAVPDLLDAALLVRAVAPKVGECVMVPGYPNGHASITAGPVTADDGADFTAHVILGPGASGAPALDLGGRLAGIATLDHDSAGTVFIGPALLATFLYRTTHLLADHPTPTAHPEAPARFHSQLVTAGAQC